jgi:GTPase
MKTEFEAVNDGTRERAILVGVVHPHQERETVQEHLEELALLSDTAGLEVVGSEIQERHSIDRTFYVGKGKAEMLAGLVEERNANMLVFDDELSPGQTRNLEKLCNVRVVDRNMIILDIFARRAQTREAKTQVELAQLQYLMPRLTRMWTHLSRQTGNAGVGLRGPGEKQLETDRRVIGKQISKLKLDLEKIEQQRTIRRKNRGDCFKVALMGYTNVGKSTLLNTLTQADVFVEDRLFATLDSTVRKMPFAGDFEILIIDTVGFIRKLPHHLVASFRSTLEETRDADLLLHVVDLSSPTFREQMETVQQVIRDMEIDDKPVLNVFNKIDRCGDDIDVATIRDDYSPCVIISAQRNIFIDELKQKIIHYAQQQIVDMDVTLPIQRQKEISRLYSLARVTQQEFDEEHVHLHLQVAPERVSAVKGILEQVGD